jgi:hypothetical protein
MEIYGDGGIHAAEKNLTTKNRKNDNTGERLRR